MLGFSWMEGGINGQSLGLQASRQLTESWNLSPVIDPDKLYRMRCAYQAVVSAPGTECDRCCERLYEIMGPNIVNPQFRDCVLPRGWFSVGCKHDVPKNACYVGHHCNTYVWVLPDGLDGLTRLTLTILNLATASPQTVSVQTTYTPDPKSAASKYGKPSQVQVTATEEVYTPPGPCQPSGVAPAVRPSRDIPRPLSSTLINPIR
jgi:hypothetical protein